LSRSAAADGLGGGIADVVEPVVGSQAEIRESWPRDRRDKAAHVWPRLVLRGARVWLVVPSNPDIGYLARSCGQGRGGGGGKCLPRALGHWGTVAGEAAARKWERGQVELDGLHLGGHDNQGHVMEKKPGAETSS